MLLKLIGFCALMAVFCRAERVMMKKNYFTLSIRCFSLSAIESMINISKEFCHHPVVSNVRVHNVHVLSHIRECYVTTSLLFDQYFGREIFMMIAKSIEIPMTQKYE